MKISSTFLIALFSFASFAKGVPVNNPTPQTATPGGTEVTEPQNDVHEQPQEHAAGVKEVIVENLTRVICTQRMRYQEFAGIEWVGAWTGPDKREAKGPSSIFINSVVKCVRMEKAAVEKWARPIESESPDHWDGTKYIKGLCETRCSNKNFGNLKFIGQNWPSKPSNAWDSFVGKCRTNNYRPLLEKVQNQYTSEVMDVKTALTLVNEVKQEVKEKRKKEKEEAERKAEEERERAQMGAKWGVQKGQPRTDPNRVVDMHYTAYLLLHP